MADRDLIIVGLRTGGPSSNVLSSEPLDWSVSLSGIPVTITLKGLCHWVSLELCTSGVNRSETVYVSRRTPKTITWGEYL